MKHYVAAIVLCLPSFGLADPFAVHGAAGALFADMPITRVAGDMMQVCGAGPMSNPNVAYCSTENIIYYDADWADQPSAAYDMAHVLGHAIQIQHGIADIALRSISARRSEEAELRSMVTRQVECLAGVLVAQAGLARFDLADVHSAEPFTRAHWGRNPLNGGPQVSIGLAARAEWFAIGQKGGSVAVCAVEEIPSDILVDALR